MGLALVVVEEHAGRAMHLGNDDPLSAVDDKGAVIGHERDVAHVDIPLLDVLDRLGAGFLIGIEYDEAQRDFERRGIGHAALPAFVDIVFRRLEFVFDEFEHRSVGEVGNREHRLEDGLQAFVRPAALRLLHQQKLVVGRLLNLNEVRHLPDFLDFSEKLSYALPTSKRLRHHVLSLNRTIGPATYGRAAASSNYHPGRMRRMLLRHPRALFRGIDAIKTTLQRAAIHRDRRDRRHSPCYSALLRAIRLLKPHRCFAVLRPGMTGRRTLHFVGSPALAPLARGCPPKPHLAMAGFGPAIYDLDSHLRLRLPSTTWTLGIPGGLAPLGRGIS